MHAMRGHGPHGRPGMRGGHHQARRGALREAILVLLAEQPMHGYQVMQELEQRSGGRWRPSPGSIYPTLQQLEDEQLVTVEELDGRRTFRLTETGTTAASALPRERGWTGGRGGDADLRGLTRELAAAAIQVGRVGSPSAIAEARTVLAETRRRLYRLLADDEVAAAAPASEAEAESQPSVS